jgi:hypothetical protein
MSDKRYDQISELIYKSYPNACILYIDEVFNHDLLNAYNSRLESLKLVTNVTEKHIRLPLKKVHFEIWLELFNKTTDFYFNGKYADKAKERAALIGWTIQSKIIE